MKDQDGFLSRPLSFDDLRAMFASTVAGAVNLFGDGCCIDTQPPFPPLTEQLQTVANG